MLVGAVMGFWAVQRSTRRARSRCAPRSSSRRSRARAMAAIHAFLVITLRANQIVSGLALTIFAGAAGLSSYLGNDLEPRRVARRATRSRRSCPRACRTCRSSARSCSRSTALVYALLGLRRRRSRCYLVAHAPGPERARGRRVAGAPPTRWASTSSAYRYVHTLAGGALAGVGGACFSLSITPQWVDGLTGGAGLDRDRARHLRVLAARRSASSARTSSARSRRCRSRSRRAASTVAPELFQALPYVMTIVVLVAVSTGARSAGSGAPAALGMPYVREER